MKTEIKIKFKVGYSNFGGLYIGKNTQTKLHKHHAIIIVLTLGQPFSISIENGEEKEYSAVIIKKDLIHKFSGNGIDNEVFIYIDPYSENAKRLEGSLALSTNGIVPLDINQFKEPIELFYNWFISSDNSQGTTENLIDSTCAVLYKGNNESFKIDERITKSMSFIQSSLEREVSLKNVAAHIHLSPGRFAHLFKQETGITFRRYILHCRLLRSIEAIYKQSNFTESSFEGGFADLPHFTRTFIEAFGTKPSTSLKQPFYSSL